jgi:hypothetical protein
MVERSTTSRATSWAGQGRGPSGDSAVSGPTPLLPVHQPWCETCDQLCPARSLATVTSCTKLTMAGVKPSQVDSHSTSNRTQPPSSRREWEGKAKQAISLWRGTALNKGRELGIKHRHHCPPPAAAWTGRGLCTEHGHRCPPQCGQEGACALNTGIATFHPLQCGREGACGSRNQAIDTTHKELKQALS